jgi:transcriptional regulator with XRE-family HTH domain
MEISFFWQNVKILLKNNDLTQKKLAEICNISFGTLQGWIAKLIVPDVFSALKIAKALNTTVEFLVTGIEPEITKQDVLNYLQNNLS